MSRVSEIATSIWTYKFSLAPVLATYLIFDLPAIVRRLTGVAYIPIYFIIFPSGHSDQLYAQYFNEDWFYGDGASMSADQKRALRHRIRATAICSMLFATIVAPWVCGFLAAFYLSSAQFVEFVWFLLITKGVLIVLALRRLRQESPAASTGRSYFYVIALYAFYLVLVWGGLTASFGWTHSNLETTGVLGLIGGLIKYAYVDLFINIIVVSAVTWALTTLFTKPENIQQVGNE